MNALKITWYWLVYSSVNAEAISNTAKGILGLLVVWVTTLMGFGLGHYFPTANPQNIADIGNALFVLLQEGLTLVSALVGVIGLITKVFRTANGTNATLIALKNQ